MRWMDGMGLWSNPEACNWRCKTVNVAKQRRLQILTIEDLLAGKKIDVPAQHDIRSFKQAPKAKKEGGRREAVFVGTVAAATRSSLRAQKWSP